MLRKQIFAFVVIGVSVTVVDYVFYLALTKVAATNLSIAKAIGFVVGATLSFLANRSLTFGKSGFDRGMVFRFMITYLFALIANVVSNNVFVVALNGVPFSIEISFAIATGISAICTFTLMKLVVFK